MSEEKTIIHESTIPLKTPSVTVREEMEEDGNFILFNADNEVILVINPAGKFILDSCTGDRNVGLIINHIKENFSIPDGFDLGTMVKDYVATLQKAELITLTNDNNPSKEDE